MKTIVVLLFSFVLFTNCSGGADSPDENTDSADVSEDVDNPVCGDGVCEVEEIGHCSVDCDEDADSPDENTDGADVGEEADVAPDVKDPLEEYMGFTGTWKRTEVDGVPDNTIVDVTIEAWDGTLGAEVWGFDPIGMIYAKKDPSNGTFNLFRDFGEDGTASGTADKDILEVELDNCSKENVCSHNIYKKLE